MASLINVDQETGQDAGGWLLFANPDSLVARERLTIKASNDGGMTWPMQQRLLLDEGRSAGYSCLTMIDAQTVGILYEGSQAQMTFQRIPFSDIVGQGEMNGDLGQPGARSLGDNESVNHRN
jgi:sialidase-1